MATGEQYRDLLTVQTASLAAKFAKIFQLRLKSQARRTRDKWKRLQNSPNFSRDTTSARLGRIMPDEEIFDFTDSRFLNPPRENRRNHPEVKVIDVMREKFLAPSQPPRRLPTPQPIFQPPENFINNISERGFYPIPVTQTLSSSPRLPRKHHVKVLKPLDSGTFRYKVSRNQ